MWLGATLGYYGHSCAITALGAPSRVHSLGLHEFSQSLLNQGRDVFSSLWGMAESLGLPIPLVVSLIPNRVVTKTLYGVEFLIGIADAERLLNRMQVTWARHVLGISGTRAGSTSLLLAACGWEQRLGTAVTLAQLLRLVPSLACTLPVWCYSSMVMIAGAW